jgi:hypothetical protein
MWYLSSSTNNGYPYNTNFIGIISSVWTDGIHNIPTEWRIDTTGKTNDGYPYNYHMEIWLGGGGGGEEGEGTIDAGSYRRNPRTARNNWRDTLTSSPHNFDITISSLNSGVLQNCNCYVLPTGAFMGLIKKDVTDYVTSLQSIVLDALANLSGTNIFNGFVTCRAYPFALTVGNFVTSLDVLGQTIPLNNAHQIYTLNSGTQVLDFGSVSLGISESWQLKECEYQIYLPFVGVMNFQPINNDTLSLHGIVDVLQGTITYVLRNSDGEPLLIASGDIGIDVPINLSQAIQARNTKSNVLGIIKGAFNSTASAVQSVQSTVQSVATAGLAKSEQGSSKIDGAKSMAGAGVLTDTANTALDLITPKQDNPTFQVLFSGNDNTVASLDMTPKILVHKAVSYNDSVGIEWGMGVNHSKYVDNLSSLSGQYVKCVNYETQNSGLTADERNELETLLNTGVYM